MIEKKNAYINIPVRIPVKMLGRLDGLPSGQIQKIACSTQEILWFAGPSGLARYDGNSVTVLGRNMGLSTQGLRTLFFTPDQRLWIGTDVGIDIMETDNTIHPLVNPAEWQQGYVDHIVPLSSQSLLFGTASGLIPWTIGKNKSPDSLPQALSGYARCVLVDSANRIWAAGPTIGLVYYNGHTWVSPSQSTWQMVGQIHCLAQGRADTILVGGDLGLAEVEPSGAVAYKLHMPKNEQPVRTALLLEDELWLGIGDELHLYRADHGDWVFDQATLKSCQINDLISDRFGNIWAGSDAQGVIKISALRKSITQLELPETISVYCIRKAADHSFLVGGNRCGFRVLPGRQSKALPLENHGGGPIWDILEDRQGVVWIASQGGLYMISDDHAQRLGEDDEVLSSPCRALLERRDSLWVGSRTGLASINGGEIERITLPTGESFGYVYTLIEDRDTKVWVGTVGSGLWRETENGFTRFVSDFILPLGNVYAIAQSEDGRMAILQDDRIVLIQRDGGVVLVQKTEEPVSGWSVQWLGADRLLVGSTSGLLEYDLNTLSIVREIAPQFGADSWEFTTSRSLTRVGNNQWMCGLTSGLLTIDMDSLNQFTESPFVTLRKITWSTSQVEKRNSEFIIAPGKWTVEIEVNAPWYIDEENIQYRHRLIGFDETWSSLRKLTNLQYSSLPSGSYSLEVQAVSLLTGAGPINRLVHIRVSSPKWFAWLAPLILLGNYAAAVIGGISRNRRLIDINLKLEHEVQERTEQLAQSNFDLSRLNSELEKLSLTDPLTGTANRRHLNQAMIREIKHADRAKAPLSMAMIDIDYFKLYNDAYGHLKGDECLRLVAKTITKTLRDSDDFIARYGGEEFAILLPNTDIKNAEHIAERLRWAVEELRIPHQSSKTDSFVTVSVGTATCQFDNAQTCSPSEMTNTADKALYLAKGNGRNQCVSMKIDR